MGAVAHRTRRAQRSCLLLADLDELLDRSHRILVFFSGQVAAAVDAAHTSVEQLGELIGGKGL